MPPIEVRPQTFHPLQSADSASPAVQCLIQRLSTCCLDILPMQASYKSCSWGKPPRPHFCAFVHRTIYIFLSKLSTAKQQYPALLSSHRSLAGVSSRKKDEFCDTFCYLNWLFPVQHMTSFNILNLNVIFFNTKFRQAFKICRCLQG